MKMDSARLVLGIIWTAFALIAFSIPLALYATGWLGDEFLGVIETQINRSWLPYCGVLAAFFFTTKSKLHTADLEWSVVAAAIVCSLIWNAVNLYFLLLLLTARSTVDLVTSNIDKYSSMLSWIVSPALGYFFGASAKVNRGAQ